MLDGLLIEVAKGGISSNLRNRCRCRWTNWIYRYSSSRLILQECFPVSGTLISDYLVLFLHPIGDPRLSDFHTDGCNHCGQASSADALDKKDVILMPFCEIPFDVLDPMECLAYLQCPLCTVTPNKPEDQQAAGFSLLDIR